MKLSTTLVKQEPGIPMKNATVKSVLGCYHDDCHVKVIINGILYDIKEIRQVSTGTGETIVHAFAIQDQPAAS